MRSTILDSNVLLLVLIFYVEWNIFTKIKPKLFSWSLEKEFIHNTYQNHKETVWLSMGKMLLK